MFNYFLNLQCSSVNFLDHCLATIPSSTVWSPLCAYVHIQHVFPFSLLPFYVFSPRHPVNQSLVRSTPSILVRRLDKESLSCLVTRREHPIRLLYKASFPLPVCRLSPLDTFLSLPFCQSSSSFHLFHIPSQSLKHLVLSFLVILNITSSNSFSCSQSCYLFILKCSCDSCLIPWHRYILNFPSNHTSLYPPPSTRTHLSIFTYPLCTTVRFVAAQSLFIFLPQYGEGWTDTSQPFFQTINKSAANDGQNY